MGRSPYQSANWAGGSTAARDQHTPEQLKWRAQFCMSCLRRWESWYRMRAAFRYGVPAPALAQQGCSMRLCHFFAGNLRRSRFPFSSVIFITLFSLISLPRFGMPAGYADGFITAPTYAAGLPDSLPSSLALGDFNGDGHMDLAVAHSN